MTLESDDLIRGHIESLAFGGRGVLKKDGFVIFVPFTVPGDEILCQITQRKKKYAFADVIEIITPSPERTDPLCPYFGSCGGCQLQNIRYDAQSQYKKQFIEDALKRIGGLSSPAIDFEPADKPYFYRERVVMHLHEGILGYYKTESAHLLQVKECPIFIKKEQSLLNDLQSLVNILASDVDARVEILKDDANFLIHFHFKKMPSNGQTLLESLKKIPQIAGCQLSSEDQNLSFGKETVETACDGLKIQYAPDMFIQNNASESQKIYSRIVSIFNGIKAKNILDLYSGIGISSLLLKKAGFQVTSIESNPIAVSFAKENASLNGLETDGIYEGKVEKRLPSLLKTKSFDGVIINPPRQGIRPEVVRTLASSNIPYVLYISCMPSTLARDLKDLSGYEIESVNAFDMFPQTSHVETLVFLKQKT